MARFFGVPYQVRFTPTVLELARAGGLAVKKFEKTADEWTVGACSGTHKEMA
jgi:hypothetical protein